MSNKADELNREADAVVVRAGQVFEKWRRVPVPERAALVRALRDVIAANKENLADQITAEVGKIRAESLGEVQEVIDIADFACGLGRRIGGVTMPSERPEHAMLEQWHPMGPVLVITAFNFPMAVWSWNAMPALVCGNPVIWKPSGKSTACARAIHALCAPVLEKAGFADLLQIQAGRGAQVGPGLIADPRIPVVSFTGSTETGRLVSTAVAARFGRCILELGGNNAAVVLADADLDLALRAILFGAVGTAGQRCTTTRRLIVHRDVRDALVSRLVAAYGQLRIGDPTRPETHVGPLIDAAAVDHMMAALDQAKAEGGQVLCGGARLAHLGPRYASPAIVEMPAQSALVQRETFAPILYVLVVDSLDAAIAANNGVPQGLSSALFTANLRAAERFRDACGADCGIVNVNVGTSGAEVGGAFGGEKDTGGGREAGSDCWKNYMRRQTSTVNYGSDLPLAQGIRFDLP
ncbi:MAG: aldehyde dehydrogenase family protein [Proteobacteria bacterium]|nr:aldehyde dehydrogenase family protein [Pseudomonadota bacterium]